MFLLLASAAHALTVDVCTVGCTFPEIGLALAVGPDEIRLTEDRRYEGFVYPIDRQLTIRRTGTAWIESGPVAPAGATVVISNGGRVVLDDVPVLGSRDERLITVTGPGTSLEILQADVQCTGNDMGGGIEVSGTATLTITGGRIQGCQAEKGGGIAADTATVTLTDLTLEGNAATDEGGGLYAEGSEVSFNGTVSLLGNEATNGGGAKLVLGRFEPPSQLVVDANTVTGLGGGLALQLVDVRSDIESASFVHNQAEGSGGAVWALDTDLTLVSTTFDDNVAGNDGGALFVEGSDLVRLVVRGGTASGGDAARGSVLYALGLADVEIDGVAWTGTQDSGRGTAAHLQSVGSAWIHGSRFQDLSASTPGGAIAVVGGAAIVEDNVFTDTSTTSDGGAAHFDQVFSARLARNLYCSTSASRGGALSFVGSCEACDVRNERIHAASANLGSVVHVAGSDVDLTHLTVVEPAAAEGSLAYVAGGGIVSVDHTVVHGAGGEVVVVEQGGTLTLDQVNVDPTSAPLSVPGATNHPTFRLGSALPDTLDCGIEFRLHPDSLVATLGAYEGPHRDESFWTTDADADAVPLAYDCDEALPTTGGLLPELPDNGVDDDCDGLIDELDEGGTTGTVGTGCDPWWIDADGDGWGGAPGVDCEIPEGAITDPARVGDCDESDPTRFPGATDLADDGVDQDCDGADAASFLSGSGCGCHSGGGAPAVVLWALVALTRRGSSRSRGAPRRPTRRG